MAKYMQVGNAVMVTDKESNNDGNIGIIIECTGDNAEVQFNFFDDNEDFNVSSLLDLTLKAQE